MVNFYQKEKGNTMQKNIFIILMILIVPLVVYFGLTRNTLTTPPSLASTEAQVIKFSSPISFDLNQLHICYSVYC